LGLPVWVSALLAVAAAAVELIAPPPLDAPVPAPARPPAGELQWLRTEGGRIVDQQGRTVTLHGFNTDTLLTGSALGDDDLEMMRRAGADVIRLPITWAGLEPRRGRFDRAYLDRIETVARRCVAHGLYVVFDIHVLGWSSRFGGEGAPDWAVVPLVPDARWGLQNVGKYSSTAADAAVAYFWLSQDWQGELQAAWRFLARRFRGMSGIAGYDLFNEPHSLPLPPVAFETELLWPFYARTIESVGAVDPNHLFIVEGVMLGNFGTTIRPLRAPNLVYSAHLYNGSLVGGPYRGDRAAIEGQAAMESAEAARLGAPLWVGELGVDQRDPEAAAWADAALDAYDERHAGWAWWQWRQDGSWGIRDQAGRRLARAFLTHVARPYLAAAPSGVAAGAGDGVRGRLDVTVSSHHGETPVEVVWPSLTQRDPRATGSCVQASRWDGRTSRLILILAPGQSCTVRLRERT
jgi:endoglycosylceramidase